MTSLKTWTGTCLAFLLMLTLAGGTGLAQEQKTQDPKAQDAKVFEGLLMDIDQNMKILTLKSGDSEMKFAYNDQTQLVAPDQDGKPPVVTQGTKMRVHYTEHAGANLATMIEIIAATASR